MKPCLLSLVSKVDEGNIVTITQQWQGSDILHMFDFVNMEHLQRIRGDMGDRERSVLIGGNQSLGVP